MAVQPMSVALPRPIWAAMVAAISLFAVPVSAQAPAPMTAGDGMAANARRGLLGTIDTAAAVRGEPLYRSSCGFCHGATARGAQGPNLTSSLIVLADPQGRALGGFLKVGRPAAGMPAFTNFDEKQVSELAAYIQARATEGNQRPPPKPDAILVGDSKAGKAYFEGAGQCASCHSATADFKGIGARYAPMVLQAKMINPKAGGRGPGAKPLPRVTVTVTEAGKSPVVGTLVQINDFYVTLIDEKGVRRTINRDNEVPTVKVDDPLEVHRQMMMRWKDKDMWNVTAYLASLK